jgi:hypothetical protein
MLSWFLRRRLDAFERQFDYDMSYAREIVEISPRALLMYFRATNLGNYRKGVALDAWFAAALVATAFEDCGPCTQLGVTMAVRAGVEPEVVEHIVSGDFDALPPHVALSARFALASLERSPEVDELRGRVQELFGREGLLSIAFGMTTSRIYPTIKYAMGHGKTCQRVLVDGKAVSKGNVFSERVRPRPLAAPERVAS